jgi:ABC-type transport system involved in multi-copper enzyme maturation permease subunit
MKSNLMILIRTELSRIWTPGKIIVAAVLTLLACVISILPVIFGWLNDIPTFNLEFSEMAINILKIIVPFSALFFASGIISNDIKNHWLRAVLSHAVTRQDVLLAKIISATISVFIMILALGILPLLVFDLSSEINFAYSFIETFQVILYFTLEAALFVAIAAWLSCFVGGFMNIFFLAGWMFLDNVVIKGVLTMWLSANTTGGIIMDFFFPSGFSEAAVIAGGSGSFPTEFLLWGLAALAFFTAAGLFHINYINIDTNSD